MRDNVNKTVEALQNTANELDKHIKRIGVAKTTGGGVAILGGLMAIGGFIAAPFTAGTSLVLTGWGTGISITGGLASLGAGIVGSILQSNGIKEVETKMIT
jgi:hypothetical protein